MSENPFYRLAPFIQQYIYRHKWTELRDIQVEATESILDTDHHLILAASTASGKTEAAFLPILTLLTERPSNSVGVLYIGPTKALINDQFYRLEGLLEEAHIPVWAWHGDVPANRKRKLLQNPQGILQITPESIESLFVNRTTALQPLFSDLRFVIIDEIHIFMHSDRGRQVLCQLQRLEAFMETPPRRVGLSATLGDYQLAERWLKAETKPTVVTIKGKSKGKVRLSAEHFYRTESDSNEFIPDPYEQYIFDRAHERTKTLIFANSRGGAESTIANFRQLARRQNLPDIYHVHHASISAPLRESAEKAMNASHQPAIIAATLTLELGIDIGQLERIIQLEAPFSVSSFLQRLGRSGRRGNPSEMWFACSEEEPTGKETIPEQIPWSLLQVISILQLYIEEQWIEPIQPVHYPLSLLYHQTMSVLAGMGELSPPALAQRILTLAPFGQITRDDYRTLLRHLITTDHLELLENGNLIIGLAGEKVVNNYRFYAVFTDNDEYSVISKSGQIGRIMTPPPEGFRFALAGRAWEVLRINHKQRSVLVKHVAGRAKNAWLGGGGAIHTRILQRMRQALFEDVEYRYLQPNALDRLAQARQLVRDIRLETENIISLSDDVFCVFPWLGTTAFNTFERFLRYVVAGNPLQISDIHSTPPFYLKLYCREGKDLLRRQIINQMGQDLDANGLLGAQEVPETSKYDPFAPDDLKRKAYIVDYIDIDELQLSFKL